MNNSNSSNYYSKWHQGFILLCLFESYVLWYRDVYRDIGWYLLGIVGLFYICHGLLLKRTAFIKQFAPAKIGLLLCVLAFSLEPFIRFLILGEKLEYFDDPSRALIALLAYGYLGQQLLRFPSLTLRALLLTAAISGAMLAFYESQYLNLRRTGNEMNPIQFGLFGCTLFMAFLVIYLKRVNTVTDIISLSIGALLAVYIILTSGTVMALIVMLLTVGLFCLYQLIKKQFVLPLSFVIAALLIVWFLDLNIGGRIESNLADLLLFLQGNVNLSGSFTTRYQLLLTATDYMIENVWFGFGPAGVADLITHSEYVSPAYQYLTDFHNGYVNSYMSGGIVGLIIFINFLLQPLIYFYKQLTSDAVRQAKAQWLALIGIGHVMVFAIFNLTQVTFSHNNGVVLYAFPLMLLVVLIESKIKLAKMTPTTAG